MGNELAGAGTIDCDASAPDHTISYRPGFARIKLRVGDTTAYGGSASSSFIGCWFPKNTAQEANASPYPGPLRAFLAHARLMKGAVTDFLYAMAHHETVSYDNYLHRETSAAAREAKDTARLVNYVSKHIYFS